MENAGEPTLNTENWTFRDLIGNSGTLTSKTHPNTYRLRFNKILEKFLCRDNNDNSTATWLMNNNEYDFSCSTSLYSKLIRNKGDFSASLQPGQKPLIVQEFEEEIGKLEKLRKELLGEGATSGQISKQAKKLHSDNINLTGSQINLLNKLDEVQNFKKGYAGDIKNATYIGKSRKQLELAYYVGGIGVMLLFILKAMNLTNK